MKYLLVLAVVLVAIHLWRSKRRDAPPRPGKAGAVAPQDMVRCPVCAVHLPRAEALPGPRGFYCCDEHRLRSEP